MKWSTHHRPEYGIMTILYVPTNAKTLVLNSNVDNTHNGYKCMVLSIFSWWFSDLTVYCTTAVSVLLPHHNLLQIVSLIVASIICFLYCQLFAMALVSRWPQNWIWLECWKYQPTRAFLNNSSEYVGTLQGMLEPCRGKSYNCFCGDLTESQVYWELKRVPLLYIGLVDNSLPLHHSYITDNVFKLLWHYHCHVCFSVPL